MLARYILQTPYPLIIAYICVSSDKDSLEVCPNKQQSGQKSQYERLQCVSQKGRSSMRLYCHTYKCLVNKTTSRANMFYVPILTLTDQLFLCPVTL